MEKTIQVRCGNCNRQVFKIVDNRYIEIMCSRCNLILVYDMKKDELTKKVSHDRIIISSVDNPIP